MENFSVLILLVALGAFIILGYRAIDNASYKRGAALPPRHGSDLTDHHWAHTYMHTTLAAHADLDEYSDAYTQHLAAYVSAMTHGVTASFWYLSAAGCVYLADAVRAGQTPADVAADMPDPTPDQYLDAERLPHFRHLAAPAAGARKTRDHAMDLLEAQGLDADRQFVHLGLYVSALTHDRTWKAEHLNEHGQRVLLAAIRDGQTPDQVADATRGHSADTYLTAAMHGKRQSGPRPLEILRQMPPPPAA